MNIKSAKKILVVRLSSLGDVLLTTPLLRALRREFPESKIDYCVRTEYIKALEFNPNVNSILQFSRKADEIQSLRASILANSYDAVIDLQHNLRSRLLLKGYKGKIYRFKKHPILKFLLVHLKLDFMKKMPPIPVRYASTVPDIKLDEKGVDLIIPEEVRPSVPTGINYIGFCPASRHYTKMWPYEYYIELGEILALHEFKTVVFGGKADKGICDLIASGIPGAINLCNDNDLFQTARDMTMCKALIVNDSGLMHVAGAVNIPFIAMFGSTVPSFGFTPYKNRGIVMQNTLLKCRPCSHYGKNKCPRRHFYCMVKLTPAMVYQQLLIQLSK